MAKLLEGRTYICGDRFTAADLYVGSQLGFMLMFGLLEKRPVFTDYVARVTDREAYRRAKQIDEQAAEEMKTAAQ
jgi:glutathione S-transferase